MPTYKITAATSVKEDAGTLSVTVSRSSGTGSETLYLSTTQDAGYRNQSDYDGLSNLRISFKAGETSKTVKINIINDRVAEGSETFGLILQKSASDGLSTYVARTTFKILDDDGSTSGSTSSSRADLTVQNLRLQDVTLSAGERLSGGFEEANLGGAASTSTTTGIYISRDANVTTGDQLLGTVSVGALAPHGGMSMPLDIRLPGDLRPGDYWVAAIADYRGQLSEGNESNNTSNAVKITVGGSVGGPVQVDQPFSRGYTVTNGFGDTDHGATGDVFKRSLYYSEDYAAPFGTPVIAQGYGRIIARYDGTPDSPDGAATYRSNGLGGYELVPGKAGYLGFHGLGNFITVEYESGLVATYAHLRSGTFFNGEFVTPTTVLAKIGATGAFTGAHGHVTYGDEAWFFDGYWLADGSLANNDGPPAEVSGRGHMTAEPVEELASADDGAPVNAVHVSSLFEPEMF